MKKRIRDILDYEDKIFKELSIKEKEIVDEIRKTEIKGVSRLSNNCVSVSFNSLTKGILTPEYYISDTQANYVDQALNGTRNAHLFFEKIQDMISEKKVKIGKNTHPLNNTTISILKKHI